MSGRNAIARSQLARASPARPRSNSGCARLLSASAQVGPKGERAIEGRERVGRAATLSERIATVGPGGGEIGRERERAIGRGQRFVTTFEVGERVAAIVMCGDEFRLKRERPVICGERLGRTADLPKRDAQHHERSGMVRPQRGGPGEARPRLIAPSELPQNLAAAQMGFSEVWFQCDGRLEVRESVLAQA